MAVSAEAEAGAAAAPRYTIANTYGNPRSLPRYFRARRFALLRPVIEEIIAEKGSCRIADIGGTKFYWDIFGRYAYERPLQIDLINLEAPSVSGGPFRGVAGDATALDAIDDNAYDLVHSNSVIEHVGRWKEMKRMAQHVRRLAPRYYVQTPSFFFPYEPHFRMPFFHWLPEQVRYRLLLRFNLGFGGRRTSVDAAMQGVQSAVLLDRRQFETLFPDAAIERERVLGLTKSFVAIRR